VVSSPVSGILAFPDAWLLVDRRGDRIVIAVSGDDVAYRSLATLEIPGLAPWVHAGAFLESGAAAVSAKAALGDLEISQVSDSGLSALYYGSPTLSGLRVGRTDAGVDFDWGLGSPHGRLGVDLFSVRWTGQVRLPVAGPVVFSTESDDGVRLWVNGQLVINNWTDHPRTENLGTVSGSLGQWVDIRLEYYERSKESVVRLRWEYPGQIKQVIPAEALRTER
jgi:hypothetical protein